MRTVEKFAPGVATVLVVDVQNDFCHPDGTMAERGRDLEAISSMIPRLSAFLDAARRFHVPIVWVQTAHEPATNTEVWSARRSTDLRGSLTTKPNCRKGSWGAEFCGVAPQEGEPIVHKHSYSAFAGTSLEWVLRTLGRRCLLVTGVATETCVESTVREGFSRDYHVNLVDDCCASYAPEGHEATIRNVENSFGLVASSDAVMAQWQSADGGSTG